jgi:hypothetical protein
MIFDADQMDLLSFIPKPYQGWLFLICIIICFIIVIYGFIVIVRDPLTWNCDNPENTKRNKEGAKNHVKNKRDPEKGLQ